MQQAARVLSIEALEEFRAGLDHFVEERFQRTIGFVRKLELLGDAALAHGHVGGGREQFEEAGFEVGFHVRNVNLEERT